MPIGSPRRRASRRRNRPPRGVPRGLVVGIVVLALLGTLYALGQFGDNGSGEGTAVSTQTSTTTTTLVPARTTTARSGASGSAAKKKTSTSAASRRVRLEVVATGPGPVYVCMQDAKGALRIPGVSLQAGARSGPYRSKSFKVRLGNGNARLRVDGRFRDVADASPVGYSVTRKAVRRIDPGQTPSCVR
jgi:hypothetical protein